MQAQEVLYQLDDISKMVCNVIDAADLCQWAHASSEWCSSANTAFFHLQEYIATLNANQDLYQSLATIVNNKSNYFQGRLNDEE
jgi:intermediate peptidase